MRASDVVRHAPLTLDNITAPALHLRSPLNLLDPHALAEGHSSVDSSCHFPAHTERHEAGSFSATDPALTPLDPLQPASSPRTSMSLQMDSMKRYCHLPWKRVRR